MNSQNFTQWVFQTKNLISPEIQKIIGDMDKWKNLTGQAEIRYIQAMANMKNKTKDLTDTVRSGFSEAVSEIPALDRAIQMLKNPYVLATGAALAFMAAGVQAVGQAATWEAAIAKANVTAQLSGEELSRLDQRIRTMAGNSSVEFNTVPEAFNRILSGVGDVEKSLKILDPTLKAAKASFTDVNVVATAAANVMNSVKGSTPEQVFDVLFATMNRGNAEFQDIANYLPKILPFSNNLGLSLQETAGAYALFTAKGQSAEASATGLQNAFRALANVDRIKAFKSLGVEIFGLDGKMRPITAIVDDLSSKMTGLTDAQRINKLASLGLDAEAASAFSIMAQNASDLKSFIDSTTNSVGALDQAVKDSKNTLADWQEVKNLITANVVMPIGDLLLPAVRMVIEGVSFVVKAIPLIPQAFQEAWDTLEPILTVAGMAVFAWGGTWALANLPVIAHMLATYGLAAGIAVVQGATWLATAATTAWSFAQGALNAVMMMNPIGAVVAGIVALIGGFVVAYQKSETFRATIAGVWEVLKNIVPLAFSFAKILFGIATMDFSYIGQTITDAAKQIQDIPNAFNRGYNNSIAGERFSRAEEIIQERKNKVPANAQEAMAMLETFQGKKDIMPKKPEGLEPINPSATPTAVASDKTSVSGSGSASKSISINISKVVGIENLNSSTVGQSLTDMERSILETLMKAFRQVEAMA